MKQILIKPICFFLVLYNIGILVNGQSKLDIDVSSNYIMSSNESLLPHYQYSNQWGVISPYDSQQGLLNAGFKYFFFNKKNLKLKAGVRGVAKNEVDDSFLQEIYVDAKFFNVVDLNIGKEEYSPVSIDDDITVGGFMRNNNSRPIPRVQIGFWDYVPIGFLNNIIEIKGGISHGILNDDRSSDGVQPSAKNVQVHEKWAYFRLGKKYKIQPYVGLYHGALLGGERYDGEKLLVDYWATFFGKGSAKLGSGDYTNAAGAHDGFWDFGLQTKWKENGIQFYIQKPFADKTSLVLTNFRNKDYKIGAIVDIAKNTLIQKISIELVKTDVQSGRGIPDVINESGSIIFLKSMDESKYDDLIMEVFGEEVHGFNYRDTQAYFIKHQNHGYEYNGRDNYNNNGMYYNSWTYQGMNMGLPLYHTYKMAMAYAPDWNANNIETFVNNRVVGIHVGLEGKIEECLNYLFKATYTNNYGSYNELFLNRYSWTYDDENIYKGGKKEVYTYLDLNYKFKKYPAFGVNLSLSCDFGELYHSFGTSFGIKYIPSINK